MSLCEDDSILDDSMSVSLFEPNPSSGNTSQHKSSSNENHGTAPTTASTSSSQKDNIFSEVPTTAPSVGSQSDSNEQDFDTGDQDEGLSDAFNEDDNLISEQPSDSDDANKENSGNKSPGVLELASRFFGKSTWLSTSRHSSSGLGLNAPHSHFTRFTRFLI